MNNSLISDYIVNPDTNNTSKEFRNYSFTARKLDLLSHTDQEIVLSSGKINEKDKIEVPFSP